MKSIKVGIVQIKDENGDVKLNIRKHEEIIKLAGENNVNYIVFPEMSITGYIQKDLDIGSMNINDARLLEIDKLSRSKKYYRISWASDET